MNAPNLISVGRLLSVPVTVWLILAGAWGPAFALFVIAGLSDAVDGYIAKRFDQCTELGRFLDPLADKTLLVSIYITLGIRTVLPLWLVILVVSRDVLIVGGALLSFAMGRVVIVQPSRVSKVNTVLQIALAAVVLGRLGLDLSLPALLVPGLIWCVAVTTALSGAGYLVDWARSQGAATNEDGIQR